MKINELLNISEGKDDLCLAIRDNWMDWPVSKIVKLLKDKIKRGEWSSLKGKSDNELERLVDNAKGKAKNLYEGMYVVKSKDGVEKRFKNADSPEALAWKEKTAKKPAKVKAEKYSQEWWEDKDDGEQVLPWDTITIDNVADQFDKIAKERGFGRIDDWHLQGKGLMKVDGVRTAATFVRMTFSFGKEDDMGLDVKGDERISDSEYVTLRRDTKNPKKLIFVGYGKILREGEVIKASFGKGPMKDTGIEVPPGFDRFELDGNKIIGIKGDKRKVVSTVSHGVLGRELVKIYNNGGKGNPSVKPVSMVHAFGSPELAALHDAGIKLTEKPSYWEDFDGEGHAAEKNVHQVALKKVEKTVGKLKVYTGDELFGTNDKTGSDKPRGPLAKIAFMPKENMFIVKFNDGTKYLADSTGASSYIRNWQKIE